MGHARPRSHCHAVCQMTALAAVMCWYGLELAQLPNLASDAIVVIVCIFLGLTLPHKGEVVVGIVAVAVFVVLVDGIMVMWLLGRDILTPVRIFRTMPPSARWGQNTALMSAVKGLAARDRPLSLGSTSSGPIAIPVRKPSRSDSIMQFGGERSDIRKRSSASRSTWSRESHEPVPGRAWRPRSCAPSWHAAKPRSGRLPARSTPLPRQQIGDPPRRASTSASQACGSTSLSLAVYAARRTMPNGLVFPRIYCDRHVIGSA